MRTLLVFLGLVVITSDAVNGVKLSNLGNNHTIVPKTCKKAPTVCNCNLTVNQDSQVSAAMRNLEMKLDKLLAQKLDSKMEKLLTQKLKTKLEKLIGLINKSAGPDFANTSSNETETCDDALKKLGTKLEKLIAQKLETRLENLLARNTETKLEKLIALINKTGTPDFMTTSSNVTETCNDALKKLETKLEKLIAGKMETQMETIIIMVNKTFTSVVSASTCKELYDMHRFTTSREFALKFGSQTIHLYCHMGNFGCGDGGWTPVMKIDGRKKTFHYNSHFWSNKNLYNIAGGRTGFNSQETKLPTYWNTAFSKICLGMKIGHHIRFVTIKKYASSLYSLIADGRYRATSLGRNTWKTLIGSQASLQTNCNKEGFNVACSDKPCSKARIGIVSNEMNKCDCCDSRIGFGTGGIPDDANACGNEASFSPDNGDKHIKAMGYILVQ